MSDAETLEKNAAGVRYNEPELMLALQSWHLFCHAQRCPDSLLELQQTDYMTEIAAKRALRVLKNLPAHASVLITQDGASCVQGVPMSDYDDGQSYALAVLQAIGRETVDAEGAEQKVFTAEEALEEAITKYGDRAGARMLA